MKRPSTHSLVVNLVVLTTGLAVVGADAPENVLRFGYASGSAQTFDAHSWFWIHNRTATEQVYEALLDVDSNLEIVPQHALAWRPVDPTTWEFQLRRDVSFHDGTPFSAEGIVFSIERARAEISRMGFHR